MPSAEASEVWRVPVKFNAHDSDSPNIRAQTIGECHTYIRSEVAAVHRSPFVVPGRNTNLPALNIHAVQVLHVATQSHNWQNHGVYLSCDSLPCVTGAMVRIMNIISSIERAWLSLFRRARLA